MEPKYKRVLLKISGEALAGEQGTGINMEVTSNVADQIKKLNDMGVEVAVVVGGGNFWRGRTSKDMNRETADYIGTAGRAPGKRSRVQGTDFAHDERSC